MMAHWPGRCGTMATGPFNPFGKENNVTCTIDKVVETVYTYECRSHVYADKIFNRLSSPYCVQVDKLKYPSQFMVVLVDNRLITNATPHDIIMAAGSSALNSIRVIGKSLKLIPRSHLKRVRRIVSSALASAAKS